jgi:N-acetylglucosaminyldiphosphoundecaprenol N-acetyl-beta-D-mannosaminyltransferase
MITLSGIPVYNSSLSSLLSDAFEPTANRRQQKTIFTINPEIIVQAHDDPQLADILKSGWRNIPDGIGILLAAKLQGKSITERITGVNLTKRLLSRAEEQQHAISIICIETAISPLHQWFSQAHPRLKHTITPFPLITEKTQGIFTEKMEKWLMSVDGTRFLKSLKQTHILFVALGAPKQEFFIDILLKQLSNNQQLTTLAVGGTFDELSGIVPAAPGWIDHIGMKWLFRLITQPWRLRRQLNLVRFLFLS